MSDELESPDLVLGLEGTHEDRVRGVGRPKGSRNKTPAQILAAHHDSDCYVDVAAPLKPRPSQLRGLLQ